MIELKTFNFKFHIPNFWEIMALSKCSLVLCISEPNFDLTISLLISIVLSFTFFLFFIFKEETVCGEVFIFAICE